MHTPASARLAKKPAAAQQTRPEARMTEMVRALCKGLGIPFLHDGHAEAVVGHVEKQTLRLYRHGPFVTVTAPFTAKDGPNDHVKLTFDTSMKHGNTEVHTVALSMPGISYDLADVKAFRNACAVLHEVGDVVQRAAEDFNKANPLKA